MLGRNLVKSAAGSLAENTTWDTNAGPHTLFADTPINYLRVSGQESNPAAIFFKSDGLKLYVAGNSGDEVNEYDLSTAWDITTATFNQNFSVQGQESQPHGLFFKSDGTKMFIIGKSGDDVNEYTLSTAWDISSASYSQVFSVSAQEAGPTGIFFKSDGTEMYITGSISDDLFQYNLTTGWDISTASYDQNLAFTGTGTPGETSPEGVFFKPDGTKMFMVGSGNDAVEEYSLSTAWDISTATWAGTSERFSLNEQDIAPKGIFFKSDGTKMYMVGANRDAIFQFDLSTAWDVSTVSYDHPDNDYLSVGDLESSLRGIFFKTDGTKLYVTGASGDDVNEYNLSTAWNIGSASYNQNFSVAAKESSPSGVFFKPDGTRMYICGQASDSIHEYHLSTAWDISTASFDASFSVSAQEGRTNSVFFKPDGAKFYIIGELSDSVHEYDLSTAWDISTASLNQSFQQTYAFSFGAGLFFKPDGTKMYATNRATCLLTEYDLSTAWDISTATSAHGGFTYQFFFQSFRGIYFKPDGTKFWGVDITYDVIYGFQLSPR